MMAESVLLNPDRRSLSTTSARPQASGLKPRFLRSRIRRCWQCAGHDVVAWQRADSKRGDCINYWCARSRRCALSCTFRWLQRTRCAQAWCSNVRSTSTRPLPGRWTDRRWRWCKHTFPGPSTHTLRRTSYATNSPESKTVRRGQVYHGVRMLGKQSKTTARC
ncbi:hypothetical protein BV22DRAFT_536517 [Leucogyrophana mollusca]|uniref:Uncharacterized protein n=1 Tax=Leucogyrophana mollusca TaxID=85980 RepID=A0ACB8BFT4_9AGAM|nr:hypothetical protein BV22DRAFT_536517 [Leucogyrophana mollusca]